MPARLLLKFVTIILLLPGIHSFAQDGLLNDDFSSGTTYNWVASTTGATSTLVNGELVIKMALQSSGKYRGDFKKNGGVTFHAGNYPIVAIRFKKPPMCNFFFDTELGSYNGTNNNATKLALDSGNIYYWDLSTGKLGTTVLSTTAPTTLSVFQFKVADVVLTQAELAANDISFEIDWVKTFRTVNELRLYAGIIEPPAFNFTGTFSHPGLLHNATDLARMKDLVTRQVARPYESYNLLKANPKASAIYAIRGPFTYLTRDASLTIDGVGGGAVKDRVESDFMAAYYNALMWNITGIEAHAQKAVEILDAYSAKTIGIIGSDAELNGLYGFMLANAAELMRYTYTNWPQQKVQQCQTMLKAVFYPTLQNFRPCAHGNWDIICMKAMMAIAIFSDDIPTFNKVVTYFYYGEGNGSIDNYVLTDAGQLQESNRDQPHTMLALGSLAELSEIALKQGVDLYTASSNAIMRGFEYTSKYNLGYTVPFQTSYEFCEKNYQDYTPEAISANGRGNLRAVFEIAYNHYAYRKGLQMPYTLEVLSVMGPEGAPFGADNPGYGSLLFFLSDSSNHRFDTTGNYLKGLVNDNFTTGSDNWTAVTSGSTAVNDNDQLLVTTAVQANGSRRGDVRRNGGISLFPKNYPIIAVKMKKPATCNFTFDTNLGSYGNGSNKWTGKAGSDIYYYDLSKTGFGSGGTLLSTTFPTVLSTFQFKVADITSGETSYTVDWVRTFKTVAEVLALDPATGLVNDNFTNTTDGWVSATTGATITADSAQLKVIPALQSNGKYRGDIRKSAGATLFPGNYPIIAIKFKKPQVCNVIFDTNLGSYGNGNNKFTGKVGADVYYYDLTKTGFGVSGTILTAPTALTTFQFKIADIASGETSYAIDWIKSVKTIEDLQKLVPYKEQTIQFDSITKLLGDVDFETGATATSGLPVSYIISDTTVATLINGKVHMLKAGSVSITVTQPGDSVYMPAEPVTRTLTVLPLHLVVQYKDGDTQVANSSIKPSLNLINQGSAALAYNELAIRYWLTAENYAGINTWIDYAQLGSGKVKMKYVSLSQPHNGAFGYIEYSFDSTAGALSAAGSSGDIQSRLANQNWANFNEADDYSYLNAPSYVSNDHITVYRNGVLVAGTEPAVLPVVTKVAVMTENRNHNTNTSSLQTYLKVVNEGNVPLNYDDLSVRYWFTKDGTASLNYWIDYAVLGNANITGQFVTVAPAASTADTYFELKVNPNTGMLYPLSNTGNVQYRIAKSDWSRFDETNDHSYLPAGAMSSNDHVTVYYKGKLIYGTEPAGVDSNARVVTAANSVVPEAAINKIMIYPNPVSGDRFYIKYNSEWFTSALNVKVYNMYGTLVLQKVIKQNNAGLLEIRLDNVLASGVYMVQLNDKQAVKLMIKK
ncbi:DUF4979 domain-containing protein [Niastella caeni]|nr:DUF4979 domain-containing protein [Niastella caeni]